MGKYFKMKTYADMFSKCNIHLGLAIELWHSMLSTYRDISARTDNCWHRTCGLESVLRFRIMAVFSWDAWHVVEATGGLKITSLTQLPLDKMAAIVADDIFKRIFLNENERYPIQISLKLFRSSPIDNKPALVQVMAWHLIGDKPLPEPMMTQFTDAYRRH